MKKYIPFLLAAALLTACSDEKKPEDSTPETTAQTTVSAAETTADTTGTSAQETKVSEITVTIAFPTETAPQTKTTAVNMGNSGSTVTASSVQTTAQTNAQTTATTAQKTSLNASDVLTADQQRVLETYLDAIRRQDMDACVNLTNMADVIRIAEEHQDSEKEDLKEDYIEYMENLEHKTYRIVNAGKRPDLIKYYQNVLEEGKTLLNETSDANQLAMVRELLDTLSGYENFFSVDIAFDDESDDYATGFLLYQKDGSWHVDAVIADDADLKVSLRERKMENESFLNKLYAVCVMTVAEIKKEGGDASPIMNKVITWKGSQIENAPEKAPQNKASSEYLRYAAKEAYLHPENGVSEIRIWIDSECVVVALMDESGLIQGYPAQLTYDSLDEAIEDGKTQKYEEGMHFIF